MTHFLKILFTALLLSTSAATFAHAQARTFVASTGNDANPCSVTAPCRTLQRGINAVADGGDVLIVDSGGFGANVTITKSVSVYAPPGGQSRLAGNGSTAVSVVGEGINVTLSGLGITAPNNSIGIHWTGGASLSIDDMDIDAPDGQGVIHAAAFGNLVVSNTTIRNAYYGFQVINQLTSDPVRATITGSRAVATSVGFSMGSAGTLAISNSVVAGSGPTATPNCINGFQSSGANAVMLLDKVGASHCERGLATVNGGTIVIANSLLTGNTNAGVIFSFGAGRSFGNNRIFGNGTNTLPGFTAIAEQ